jgi:hypothetical protein
MEESRPPVSRRLPAVAIVLAAMLVSAAYGYFVHRNRLFPYGPLQLAQEALRPIRQSMQRQYTQRRSGQVISPETIDRLVRLPYLRGYRRATGGAVVPVHERALSEDGLNFFTSSHAPVAILMDMEGRVVKTWKADAAKVFPGSVLEVKHKGHEYFLRDAEILPDGGIVAMFDQIGLVRLDVDSRIRWAWPGRVHHDLFVDGTGNVWSLLQEKRSVPEFRAHQAILDDLIVELSPEGKLVRRISLLECFRRSRYAPLLANVRPEMKGDYFHANSVIVLDGSLAARSPAFRRGNLLVSVRNLNAVAVVDPDANQVVWALTGLWRAQHCARLLSDDHLLLFDNFGTMRVASRVLELDPFTQEILWSFGGRPGEDLLSETVGFVERLRGGNTLITESNFGRVLEVTPQKRVVWEFVNPNRVGAKNELIAIVYFMQRVPRDLPFLTRSAAGSPSGSPAGLLR